MRDSGHLSLDGSSVWVSDQRESVWLACSFRVAAGDRVKPRAVANPDRIANKAGEQKAGVNGVTGDGHDR